MKSQKDTFINIFKKQGLSKAVVEAAASIDREEFFDSCFAAKVYTGEPLLLGRDEKSDEALTLAAMIKVLNPQKGWRVLEVGTGSGFSTALLSSAVKEVVTIDYHEELALKAKERLLLNGFTNIKFFAGDVSAHAETFELFDAVIVFAGCKKRPLSLLNAIADGGTAVFPMGPPHQQQITRFYCPPGFDYEESLQHCTFHDFCVYDSIRGIYGWVDRE
jgi:protein-L-isoaspartate(D-aspartate) O-methyltransferase